MESVVSINIKNINNKITINDYPVLLYINDDDIDIKTILYQSNEFKQYIENNIDIDNYSNVNLYICYYNSDTDEHTELIINLQNLFYLKDFSNEYWIKYCINYFKYLYDTSYKYDPINNFDNNFTLIKFIYSKLLQKYPKKINANIVINYVLSKIMEDYKELSQENINYIKNELFNLLK